MVRSGNKDNFMHEGSMILLKKMCDSCDKSLPNITKKNMTFLRKINYSGRSLSLHIPEDVAKYIGIEKGSSVKIIPVNKKSFLVELSE